jgi:hypothetical protein
MGKSSYPAMIPSVEVGGVSEKADAPKAREMSSE